MNTAKVLKENQITKHVLSIAHVAKSLNPVWSVETATVVGDVIEVLYFNENMDLDSIETIIKTKKVLAFIDDFYGDAVIESFVDGNHIQDNIKCNNLEYLKAHTSTVVEDYLRNGNHGI